MGFFGLKPDPKGPCPDYCLKVIEVTKESGRKFWYVGYPDRRYGGKWEWLPTAAVKDNHFDSPEKAEAARADAVTVSERVV